MDNDQGIRLKYSLRLECTKDERENLRFWRKSAFTCPQVTAVTSLTKMHGDAWNNHTSSIPKQWKTEKRAKRQIGKNRNPNSDSLSWPTIMNWSHEPWFRWCWHQTNHGSWDQRADIGLKFSWQRSSRNFANSDFKLTGDGDKVDCPQVVPASVPLVTSVTCRFTALLLANALSPPWVYLLVYCPPIG